MILSAGFFNRSIHRVARDLLGATLVRTYHGHRLAGCIVEVEAYDGPQDLACHASKGNTPRTAVMFGPAGITYIYFTYGMHWCLNIVTGPQDYPAAVLIRAIEPSEGLSWMSRMRHTYDPSILTSGPSRLCEALALTGAQNNQSLGKNLGLWIEQGPPRSEKIATASRVGVDYAGPYRLKPWRYLFKGNPFVSK